MVINNNPSYAYLLEGNSLTDQKLVMAHVFGHVDFFKNNFAFRATDLDATRAHRPGAQGRGLRPESQLDRQDGQPRLAHSARHRAPRHPQGRGVRRSLPLAREPDRSLGPVHVGRRQRRRPTTTSTARSRCRGSAPRTTWRRSSIPRSTSRRRSKKIEAEREREKRLPERPERDVLCSCSTTRRSSAGSATSSRSIREEAYYFVPQMQTKIMNEGWASYWHSKMMTEKVLDATEIIDYADNNAGVMATSPGRLNPYKLGVELYRYIEERWNKGQFGREWEECDDLDAKKHWDLRLGLGRKKIFEVRALYNDVTFIDEFLTPEFCREQKMFTFGWSNRNDRFEIETREFKEVKEKLLVSAHEFRQSLHLRRGRQLRQPRRAPARARAPGRRSARRLRQGDALVARARLEAAGLRRDEGRGQIDHPPLRWPRALVALEQTVDRSELVAFAGADDLT